MPRSLATSGTVEPEAILPSACRSFRMICSGECLLPIESPPFAHSGLLDSHPSWTRFWGAGHHEDEDSASNKNDEKAVVNSRIEQETGETGDVSMSANISSSGNNSNQTAPTSQVGNSGNLQNAQDIVQQGSEADDIQVEGGSVEISPEQGVQSGQAVQQSSAVNGE